MGAPVIAARRPRSRGGGGRGRAVRTGQRARTHHRTRSRARRRRAQGRSRARAGRERARRFTWALAGRQTAEVYRKCLRGPSADGDAPHPVRRPRREATLPRGRRRGTRPSASCSTTSRSRQRSPLPPVACGIVGPPGSPLGSHFYIVVFWADLGRGGRAQHGDDEVLRVPQPRRPSGSQVSKAYVIYLPAQGLSARHPLGLQCSSLHLSPRIGQILAIFISTVFSYLGHKYFTFRAPVEVDEAVEAVEHDWSLFFSGCGRGFFFKKKKKKKIWQ